MRIYAVVVCFMLAQMNQRECGCYSLKLNVVQPLPLLPLAEEIDFILNSGQEARSLIMSARRLQEGEKRLAFLNEAARTLRMVTNRWKNTERKYHAISNPGDQSLLQEAIEHVTSVQLFLINLYLFELRLPEEAIAEYERVCPTFLGQQKFLNNYDTYKWFVAYHVHYAKIIILIKLANQNILLMNLDVLKTE